MKKIFSLLFTLGACAHGSAQPPAPNVVAQRQPPAVAPTNDLPNPYRTVEGWAKMPAGRAWGSTSAVDVDRDGLTLWVAERCGANSCAGSDLAPVLKFDASGKLLRAFGEGLLVAPHGIFVDRDGTVIIGDSENHRVRAITSAPAR